MDRRGPSLVGVDEGFNRLRDKIRHLGPHLERFVLIAERRIQDLLGRLEAAGLRHRVWLWDVAQDLAAEMDVVIRVGRDREEKLSFLGTYHALQLIHLNLALLDSHALVMSRSPLPRPAQRQFLRNSCAGFERMLTGYMTRVLALLLPQEQAPHYVLLNVGTRWDRDDLDLCVVDDGSERREHLRRAVARLSTEMLRHATRIDFHVSEEVGGNRYSASIEEYLLFLRRSPRDFVSASEMLGADFMLGSRPLFEDFASRVRELFFFSTERSNLYHESFLRGVLGEALILATRPVDESTLRIKQDAIRPIKGILAALRALYNLEVVDPLLQFEALKQRAPERAAIFADLEDHLVFFEAFRQLYHFHVEEAEEIHLGLEIPLEQRHRIAELMGYEAAGTVDAWDGLIFRYHQRLRRARQLVLTFAEQFKGHLGRITVFKPILAQGEERGGSLLARAARAGRHFKGTGYWDDLLDAVASSPGTMEALLAEVLDLPEARRERLVLRLARGVHRTTRGIMRLINILQRYQRIPGLDGLLRSFVARVLDNLGSEPDLAHRLVHAFLFDSKMVCDFLGALTEQEQQKVAQILKGVEEEYDLPSSEEAFNIRRLTRLFYSHSRHFQRFFLRVVERHPYLVPHLTRMETLDRIVRGLGAWAPERVTFQERREALGDAFDIEVVRMGLTTLTSPLSAPRGAVFLQLFGPYLSSLFRVCRQETLEETGAFEMADADMALFLTGGAARGDAFAEDCDLFGVCAREDEAPFFSRVLGRVGKELGQRGLMADFCLADSLGGTVCTLDRIVIFMQEQSEHPLVASSLFLGSRLAEGGERFRRRLLDRVIRPYIFDHAAEYIKGMAAQIATIQAETGERYELDIKEGPGGLRVQEMVLLMAMAWAGLFRREDLAIEDDLARRWPEIEAPLRDLSRVMLFFRNLRDVYWVTVSATNAIDPNYLHRPAQILGIRGHDAADRARMLLARLIEERERSSQACLELSGWFLAQARGGAR